MKSSAGTTSATVAWIVLFLYIALVFYLSSRPKAITPIYFPGWDKVAHIVEYGILGFLSQLAARLSWPSGFHLNWPSVARRPVFLRVGTILILGILIGVMDEVMQSGVLFDKTTERISSPTDVSADAIGVTIGMILNIKWWCPGRGAAVRPESSKTGRE